MSKFEEQLKKYFTKFIESIASEDGSWTVKGFIDIYKNVYTISVDTKVISKIVELMIFPIIVQFANDNNYEMILAPHQNYYPDITFIDRLTNEKIALDLKSSYRVDKNKVNGMTLGAFTGYFRNRNSTKNITFPYNEYSSHLVLGILYSKTELYNLEKVVSDTGFNLTKKIRDNLIAFSHSQSNEFLDQIISQINDKIQLTDKLELSSKLKNCLIDEKKIHNLDLLDNINSVVRDFDFFVQEKWKIATDRPGSGNTKNIGSVNLISDLKNGNGIFSKLKNGKEVFDDFWMYYLTKEMSKNIDLEKPPYSNLDSYFKHKKIGND